MDGEGEISIGQDRFHLHREQLYLIPANTVHTYQHNPERPIIKYWCHFQLTLRLQLATQQLIQTPLKPIKNIAQDVGFSEYHYFTRLFKRKYGITPSNYRSTGQSSMRIIA